LVGPSADQLETVEPEEISKDLDAASARACKDLHGPRLRRDQARGDRSRKIAALSVWCLPPACPRKEVGLGCTPLSE
jgi:hypothetical protein